MKKKGDDMDEKAEPLITRRTLEVPPWRDRLPDGSLGGEYGPRDVNAYAEAQRTYRQSVRGGGFWDEREHARLTMRPNRASQRRARFSERDAADLTRFMRSHSSQVPAQEQAVYTLVVVDGHSTRYSARRLNMSRDSVRTYLGRLRHRLVKYLAGQWWQDGPGR